ncbi:dro myosuppressin receptor isoform 2 [Schistosoma japonicum]|uniref:Dro myosuppressin receptor isoform 2 n=1 Tax=Schistosoma japonicum TaxID=6182 RepID=A0A4Z2D0Y0_SCHJA|nr:dro myosuppressin receptor isoform 2 [Schistosoma japonicum]
MITTTLTTTIMSSTINTMNNTCIDHFQWLEVFHQNYQRIHVYLCLLLCPIGVIANTLNVVVLCQARLRSPTNLLLSVLAVTYAQLLLINIVLQNLFHAFSAWIIVAVAIFRLIYIKTGVRAAIYCNMFKAWIVILLVLISSILLTIPFMIAHQNLRIILFWNSAILVKALPILIMTTVSAALISSIRESEKRYRILRRYHNYKNFPTTLETTRVDSFINNEHKDEKMNDSQRPKHKFNSQHETYSGGRSANQTTYMLLTIIILYIVTYLPQLVLRPTRKYAINNHGCHCSLYWY